MFYLVSASRHLPLGILLVVGLMVIVNIIIASILLGRFSGDSGTGNEGGQSGTGSGQQGELSIIKLHTSCFHNQTLLMYTIV